MVVRLNSLLGGHSGVHEDPLRQLEAFLNQGITPIVPRLGSLGASGDLAPLSHVALALIGEGAVQFEGRTLRTGERSPRHVRPPTMHASSQRWFVADQRHQSNDLHAGIGSRTVAHALAHGGRRPLHVPRGTALHGTAFCSRSTCRSALTLASSMSLHVSCA